MEVLVKLVPSGLDEDGEEQHMELDAAILDSLKPALREAVCKKVDAVTNDVIKLIVRERVALLSVAAFEQAFQATDSWGKKKGEEQSLAEIVKTETGKFLAETVDHRGDPSYSGTPRCKAMVTAAIQESVKGEIDKELKTLRAEFAGKIADKLAKVTVS